MNKVLIAIPEHEKVAYEVIKYPAGEIQVRILPEAIRELRTADEVIVRAKITDGNPMVLALLNDAINNLISPRTNKVLLLPYLPYSRADRRFTEGDCFALKVFGEIIDGLGFNEVRTLDVHSPVARHYIANLITLDPGVYIRRVLRRINLANLAIMLPDKGSLTRYNLSAFGKRVVHADKMRDPQTGRLSGFKVPSAEELEGLDAVLIIDDICDGGGTFIGIAEELKKVAPKLDLYLYVSHGIFSAGLTKLQKTFKRVFTTDSFPFWMRLFSVPCDFVELV